MRHPTSQQDLRTPGAPENRHADTGHRQDSREARVRSLKAKIRNGCYDADSKIESLIDEIVRDTL